MLRFGVEIVDLRLLEKHWDASKPFKTYENGCLKKKSSDLWQLAGIQSSDTF